MLFFSPMPLMPISLKTISGPGTTYTSTAYATMKGHLIRGEERVTVAFRDDTGHVDVEILSLSKPGPSIKGRLAWPLLGNMQQKFFLNQLDFFSKTAAETTESTTTRSKSKTETVISTSSSGN